MLKTITRNAGWLALVQVLNLGIPIITLPIIARAFGPTTFGVLALISAYAAYPGLAINYGFNLTGPRIVSRLRTDIAGLSKQLSAILFAQFLLGTIASAMFFLLLSATSLTSDLKLIGIGILTQAFATAITPQWIFIGLERIGKFAISQLVVRSAAAIAILATVRRPSDLGLYVFINAMAALVAALSSFSILSQDGIHWTVPTLWSVASNIRDATRLFISTASINLYTTTNVLLVNLILGPAGAASFALADKVRSAAMSTLGPVTNAIYPFVCGIIGRHETPQEAHTKRIFFRLLIGASFLMVLALLWLAPLIVHVIGGREFEDAVPVLRLMAFLPLITILSNIFGIQTMMPLNMDRQVSWVVTSAAVLGVVSMLVLSSIFTLKGAGLSMLIVESYVTVAMGILLGRRLNIMYLFFRPTRNAETAGSHIA